MKLYLLSYDTLTFDTMNMRLLIDRLGVDRLIMGSDYPFPLGETPPGVVIDALDGILHDERVDMLGRNALRFLGQRVVPEKQHV